MFRKRTIRTSIVGLLIGLALLAVLNLIAWFSMRSGGVALDAYEGKAYLAYLFGLPISALSDLFLPSLWQNYFGDQMLWVGLVSNWLFLGFLFGVIWEARVQRT